MNSPPVADAGAVVSILSSSPQPGRILTGEGGDGIEVGVFTLAENEGGRGVVGRGVGDLVGLASLDLGGELVDLNGQGSSNEGSAGEEGLEETHVDDLCGLRGRVVLEDISGVLIKRGTNECRRR